MTLLGLEWLSLLEILASTHQEPLMKSVSRMNPQEQRLSGRAVVGEARTVVLSLCGYLPRQMMGPMCGRPPQEPLTLWSSLLVVVVKEVDSPEQETALEEVGQEVIQARLSNHSRQMKTLLWELEVLARQVQQQDKQVELLHGVMRRQIFRLQEVPVVLLMETAVTEESVQMVILT
jgi:hypothetical protein